MKFISFTIRGDGYMTLPMKTFTHCCQYHLGMVHIFYTNELIKWIT